MKILSIETSCDDTGISILEAKGSTENASFNVLADSLISQDIHSAYGGVFPMMAKREHIKNLPILLDKVLRYAGFSLERSLAQVDAPSRENFQQKIIRAESEAKSRIDAIAVTYGPGLEPCLWTGIVFAQELSKKWNVPVIPTNHMEGHIFSVFGKNKGEFKFPKIVFPVLTLLVSGGHTELVLVKDFGKYKILGKTLDDAAGEAYDKVARMLGLPYPGGPALSRLASQARKLKIKDYELEIILPRPMLYSKNLNFSFSGLKTAVLYLIKKIQKTKELDEETKSQIALEFENAVVETLVHKTKKAMEEYKVSTLIVAGGVAANKHLRNEMKKLTKLMDNDTKLFFPTPELSRDNALMIGIAGYLQFLKKKGKFGRASSIKAKGDLAL